MRSSRFSGRHCLPLVGVPLLQGCVPLVWVEGASGLGGTSPSPDPWGETTWTEIPSHRDPPPRHRPPTHHAHPPTHHTHTPVDRMTDTCKSITFQQLRAVSVKQGINYEIMFQLPERVCSERRILPCTVFTHEPNVSYQFMELPFELDIVKSETRSKQEDRQFPHLMKRSVNYTANTVMAR